MTKKKVIEKQPGWNDDGTRYDGYKPTSLETIFIRNWEVWQTENRRGLHPFEFQHKPFEGEQIRVDFAWPDYMLIAELQGGQWSNGGHNRGSGMARDYDRHNRLVLNGWRVLYFATSHIDNNPLGVVGTVAEALKSLAYQIDSPIWNLPYVGSNVIPVPLENKNGDMGCWHRWHRTESAKQVRFDCSYCGMMRLYGKFDE